MQPPERPFMFRARTKYGQRCDEGVLGGVACERPPFTYTCAQDQWEWGERLHATTYQFMIHMVASSGAMGIELCRARLSFGGVR